MASNGNNQIAHRPGPLKQSNKAHKCGRGKNSRRNDKGKLDVKAISHSRSHDLNRKDRKNRANQLRKLKREATFMKKRGLEGLNNPPVLVAILSLCDYQDPFTFMDQLKTCDEDLIVSSNNKFGHCHINFTRQRQRYTFMIPKKSDLNSVMDAVKVADVLVIIHSNASLNDYTEMLLSTIVAHSLPTTIHVIQGFDKINPKKKAEIRKSILKIVETRFPGEKLHQADTKNELQLVLRQIGFHKQRAVGFRDNRPHLVAEDVDYIPNLDTIGSGTLRISGYVRGESIDVNGLVHIPGWGNYQMCQLDCVHDPHPLAAKNAKANDEEMGTKNVFRIDVANSTKQESLQSEIVPDPMEGEQTWPTREELEAAIGESSKKTVKKVAEGTSEYQASWIVDSDTGEESDSEEEVEKNEDVPMSEDGDDMDYDIEDEESVVDIKEDIYDKNFNVDEERQMLVRFKEERMNQMYPDEQDTPIDISARIRYQRYRGLKNFNSSPWDTMENLPSDYAKIYRFQNFIHTKKKVLTAERDGVMPGFYVTLHIVNIPKSLYDSVADNSPLIVYGLLPHEQKMSVINVVIRKHPLCKTPIMSKDNLIFHIGYRRFTCKPIFSEHKTGNKFKYERFLPSDCAVVASFIAPVIFPPASVVVFAQQESGVHQLVATGSLLDANPNRVIVKRIMLSGHPLRIFKRSAVVRYMFFNKEDINWFKCVELRSKCGRRGHIRESLGSHGHMKCIFDRQLQSQDVVLMALYKRVFPKWTYDPYVPTSVEQCDDNVDNLKPMI